VNGVWRRGALFAAGVAGAGALVRYALDVEPYLLEFTRPSLTLPHLPAALEGITILLLSDPHVTTWGRREDLLLALLRDVPPPDVIVWGGDFIMGRTALNTAVRLVDEVATLFRGIPAFGILGNAEHKIAVAKRRCFVEHLQKAGVSVLLNEHASLHLRGVEIIVVGVDDPYYGFADLNAALAGAPVCETFTLLLAHSPQIAAPAARAGVDLMLSGHTHGGQVRLPLVGPLKTQNPLGRKMDQGTFYRARLANVLGRDPGGDMVTYVTRGIGTATLPGMRFAPRLFCRPEVALLTLRRPVP
jgi:predicted MPP superfamily phosphohydrolase